MFSEMQEKFSFGKLFACFGKRAPKKRRWKTRAEKGDGKRAPENEDLQKIPEHDKVKDGKRKGRVDFGKRNHIYAGHCQHSGGILSVLSGRRPVRVHDVPDVSGSGGKKEKQR